MVFYTLILLVSMGDEKDGDKMLKVMLVDDEEWCLEELSKILSEVEGIKITGTYSNGNEAMKSAIRDGPDIAFIDVELRGISGLELAQRIKSKLPNVCIVLLSEKECFARNGFDIGVDDYILKPFRKERVIKSLGRIGSAV